MGARESGSRCARVAVGAAVGVAAATSLSLLVGTQPITPADVVTALTAPAGHPSDAVAQGLTRDPLAGPEVFGVNSCSR